MSIKVLSLFSGIGAFEKALDRLNIPYELEGYCEIDKYASKSYSMIHNCDESMNFGDITQIDTSKLSKDIDLITYGFPCQDISLAGKQKGFEHEGERTRSGLFFEALRIIEDTKPKLAIAENVKNLVSKKFKKEFEIVLNSLEEAGYNNYWKVLNAKNFGIPQNRERVFIVSIRKDIDSGTFEFPEGFELKKRLKDVLENEVDEKYYLSDKIIQGFIASSERHKAKGNGFQWKPKTPDDIATCLRANGALGKTDNSIRVGGVFDTEKSKHQAGSVWDKDGLSPTLDTMQGGYRQPCVLVPEKTKKGYAEAKEGDGVYINRPHQKRGCVQNGMIQTLKTSLDVGVVAGSTQKNAAVSFDGVCPTLTEAMGKGGGHVPMHNYELRIRKLTPLECFRLMGFSDDDFHKIKGISNTQLYKQAGNSIVVDVLVYLFKQIFKYVNLEVENVKKIEEVKTIKFETDKMIDLATLKEKEPELFDELATDYPCEAARYVFDVVETQENVG